MSLDFMVCPACKQKGGVENCREVDVYECLRCGSIFTRAFYEREKQKMENEKKMNEPKAKVLAEEKDYIEKALGSGLVKPNEMKVVLCLHRITQMQDAPTLMNVMHLWKWCGNEVDRVINTMPDILIAQTLPDHDRG